MTPQALNPAAFSALADEEARVVAEFVQTLRQEQEALVAGQIDQILPLAEAKEVYCQRLDIYARKRLMLLSGSGLAAGPKLDAWLERQAPSLQTSWQALLKLADEARNLNRQNGQLISSRMQSNSQALNVLLSAADRTSLYGPDGQPRTGLGGRMLGKV
ncbi:MAG: flagellar protein FlgN [Rhodocyclaceae bacterium]|nr:flagellar protein FlgN [Rhodocyclaceae bacterium]